MDLDDLYEVSVWDALSPETKELIRKVDLQLDAADALAAAANNLILDPDDPHTFLEIVKVLREYREAK